LVEIGLKEHLQFSYFVPSGLVFFVVLIRWDTSHRFVMAPFQGLELPLWSKGGSKFIRRYENKRAISDDTALLIDATNRVATVLY
jgi:hypothetical protein